MIESKLNILNRNVIEWALERGLIKKENSFKQLCKTMEELGEMSEGLNKNKPQLFKDGMGDVLVTLIILSEQNDTSIEECLEIAWNEIKDRTGRTVNGVFIKKEDL